ncbi:hypothetical protein [Mycobacterium sp. NPDC050853]|uniref:hypothetical protein n=1 Tax=Mycobacterium sp. NPDC050853 TaxID=3155160 RepID=UPI0034085059
MPPLPGPPPQSGGQSARAIATIGLEPSVDSGAMIGTPTAAATIATMAAALEARRSQRRVDTPVAEQVWFVMVFKVSPLVR